VRGRTVGQLMDSISRLIIMFIVFFCILMAPGLYAEIELPFLIGDGMVVQRGELIPIWGRGDADTEITLKFAGETRTVRSDGGGAWHTDFNAREAGGPYELRIRSGRDSRTVRDILVGDVWLCSGQSNMELVLRNTENAEKEIANSENSNIRHFGVPHTWSVAPSDRLAGGSWTVATPDTAGEFTAVGYYFAKKIHAETGVPIGLLHSSWGGSNIESWMSPRALEETDEAALGRMERLAADAERSARSIRNKLGRWPNALVDRVETADADWSAAELDESDWIEIPAPQLWEEQGFEGVDGVVWYRKTFHLDAKQAAGGIVLGLARIDDNDIAWVNSHKVGETNAYDLVRRYEAPAEFLKSGENRIAIRIEDTGGGGGIYSDPALLYVETSDGMKLSLAGPWKIKADRVTVSLMTDVNHTPTALYNKMLHPLFAFPIKGVLWYQGESNADNVEEALNYREQFQDLIKDWRKSWRKPELAFYWVQLANFNTNKDTAVSSPWAIVRDAQTAALELPNTGQAITIDVGNPNDIHPRDKKTVGTRLALIALNKTYGRSDISYSGPVLDTCKVEGADIKLSFSNSGSKLAVADGGNSVMGFEIAGADGSYKSANASIQNNTVIVSNESVKQPLAVRYAWKDNPEEANLIGGNGLPAGPFRLTISR
jgi:sialate O-acetylesterase